MTNNRAVAIVYIYLCLFSSYLLRPVFVNADEQHTRNYQMALWTNSTGNDADIAFFSEGENQPPGRSVLLLNSWAIDNFLEHWDAMIAQLGYDFNRIDAALVDEPYWNALGTIDRSNPCRDARAPLLAKNNASLQNVAAVVKLTSWRTRFWINFSEPEVLWMMDTECPAKLNQPYIDVVSIDVYWKSFTSQPQFYYRWLISHRPSSSQQIALVPGTFFRQGIDNPAKQAEILDGYFQFAEEANTHCGRPRSDIANQTNQFDQCLVWMVAGWLAPTITDGGHVTWRGEQDSASTAISTKWRRYLARPIAAPKNSKGR
jgi:hypothetical protein